MGWIQGKVKYLRSSLCCKMWDITYLIIILSCKRQTFWKPEHRSRTVYVNKICGEPRSFGMLSFEKWSAKILISYHKLKKLRHLAKLQITTHSSLHSWHHKSIFQPILRRYWFCPGSPSIDVCVDKARNHHIIRLWLGDSGCDPYLWCVLSCMIAMMFGYSKLMQFEMPAIH